VDDWNCSGKEDDDGSEWIMTFAAMESCSTFHWLVIVELSFSDAFFVVVFMMQDGVVVLGMSGGSGLIESSIIDGFVHVLVR